MSGNAWLGKNMLKSCRIGLALLVFCVPLCLVGCADKQAADPHADPRADQEQAVTPPDPDAPSFKENALAAPVKQREIYSEVPASSAPVAPGTSSAPVSPVSPGTSSAAASSASPAPAPGAPSHSPAAKPLHTKPPLTAAPLHIGPTAGDAVQAAPAQKVPAQKVSGPKAPEQKAAAPKASPAQAPVQAPVQAAVQAPSPRNEQAAYKAALAAYEGRRYEQGEKAFDAFLRDYPGSKLAPNALYWKAECLYTRGRYPDAIYVFKEVTARFPKHPKASDALLKAGMSYDKMKDADNARLHYQVLLEDYPGSQAATKAKALGLVR